MDVLLLTCAAVAQVPAADSIVPRLVNYTGVAKDETAKAMKGVIGATFAVYADQMGGSPLWMETQNIVVGPGGRFSVTLGSATSSRSAAGRVLQRPSPLAGNHLQRWIGTASRFAGQRALRLAGWRRANSGRTTSVGVRSRHPFRREH